MKEEEEYALRKSKLIGFLDGIPESTRHFLIKFNKNFKELWETYEFFKRTKSSSELEFCLDERKVLKFSSFLDKPLHL